MNTKVFFFFAVFGVASSQLPYQRTCDPEPRQDRPTSCTNYKNILYLEEQRKTASWEQTRLERKIHVVEKKSCKIDELEQAVEDLSKALSDVNQTMSKIVKEFKDMKTQLENHQDDIAGLKRDIEKQVEHNERVGGNFNEIEKRLGLTESQLLEKKAKLENLENKTETAFSHTQRLLDLYNRELSHLNVTAQELEDNIEDKLGATRTELESKLKKLEEKSEIFSTKLHKQIADVAAFKGDTNSKFEDFEETLETQQTTLNQQGNKTGTLQIDISGITKRLSSTEKTVDELKVDVNAKVAFSATIIESNGVFTGPKTAGTSSVLVFNRVLTNVGDAYNSKTGTFTAPLKGVYHFSFMTFGYNSHTSGAILVKNGHYQVSTWEFTGPDASDTTSNTVILELNVGDRVNVILWEGGKVHTSVFSGFLIFIKS